MTDIEAKALALVNAHAINRRSDLDDAKHTELRCALLDAVQSQAATEARHAAELRELKERFSEVAGRAVKHMARTCFAKVSPRQLEREAVVEGLTDFILPAPDPLVEALKEAYDAAVAELGEDYVRKLSWFPSARKIGVCDGQV